MEGPLATALGTLHFKKTDIGPNVMLRIPANAVVLPQCLMTGDGHFEPMKA